MKEEEKEKNQEKTLAEDTGDYKTKPKRGSIETVNREKDSGKSNQK